jgi:DNA-3-methyladenine glycosylase II
MSFAWPVDGDWTTARVELRQVGERIEGDIADSPSPDLASRVRRDVERILCLDVDGSGYTKLAERDPVVAGLQKQFPGLRPVLFYTPYEAAAWCIIGQRIRTTQAVAIKRHLADELGQGGAFPAPARLAQLTAPFAGLTEKKVDQLRQLAAAALDGALDRDQLRSLPYDEAGARLQQLPGIGPFSTELIMIRGVGVPDAFPEHEQRLQRAIRDAYGLPEGADTATAAEGWRPYRSWVGLLLRASSARTS